MNAQDSRKIIVAVAMAAVVGVGVMTYAMRPHPIAHVAQAIVPPPPLAEIPASPPAAAAPAETPAVAAPVAPIAPLAVVPAVPAHKDVVASKRKPSRSTDADTATATEPSVIARRHTAAPNADVSATYNTVTPKAVMPDLGMTSAAAAVVPSADPTSNAATAPDTASVAAATPAAGLPAPAYAVTPSPSAAADIKVDPNTAVVAAVASTDTQITTNVKSQIAADSQSKDAGIDVSTSNGVVALTGRLPSKDALDHVKIVVASVKDVKSVDTSALIVPNL